MDNRSTAMTSLATTTSSDFSTKISMPATSLDHDVGCSELQPQVRILRHYRRDRAASASPPSAKRRPATMPNGTRRLSPATGGRVGVRQIVDVDGVRSLPATPLPPPKTCTSTTNAVAATTTVTTTTASTTTTSKTISTNKSSLLVMTETPSNARTTYSTFDCSLDVRLPLDGVRQSTSIDSEAKIRKFDKSGNSLAASLDNTAAKVTKGKRWSARRQAVVGAPSKDVTQTKTIQRVRRCVGCLKSFVAFLFSTIGLTFLLVGYTILGGIIFKFIEAPKEV